MNFLPIGSIVLLKGASRFAMIIGYLVKDINNNEKDYMGVPYPEGIVSEDSVVTFNNSDIEKVQYEGFKNVFYDKFMDKLNKNMKEQ